MCEDNDKKIERLWQHALHEDLMFNERLNFFLVFESLLIATVASLYNASIHEIIIIKLLNLLGLFLTAIWCLVQVRQKSILDDLKNQTKELIPDYEQTLVRRSSLGRKFSITFILAYGVPALVASIWIVLLFFIW